jgi:hypothetical protein
MCKYRKKSYFILLIFVCFVLSGCAIYNSFGKFSKAEKSFKKTVWLASFENSSSYKTETNNFIKDSFVKVLKQDNFNNIYIEKIEKKDKSIVVVPRTVSGSIDNFALSEIGRSYGINYVVRVALVDFTTVSKEKGIFFKKKKRDAVLRFFLTVYNTKTAAKLIEEESVVTVSLGESQYNRIKNREMFGIPSVNLAIKKNMESFGKIVGREIAKQPFVGYVKSIDKRMHITVVPGKNAGIEKDCLFDIFSKGKIIKGFSGSMYIIPGHKIGEIKIVSATEKRARAVIISGKDFDSGSVIKVKNK